MSGFPQLILRRTPLTALLDGETVCEGAAIFNRLCAVAQSFINTLGASATAHILPACTILATSPFVKYPTSPHPKRDQMTRTSHCTRPSQLEAPNEIGNLSESLYLSLGLRTTVDGPKFEVNHVRCHGLTCHLTMKRISLSFSLSHDQRQHVNSSSLTGLYLTDSCTLI